MKAVPKKAVIQNKIKRVLKEEAGKSNTRAVSYQYSNTTYSWKR